MCVLIVFMRCLCIMQPMKFRRWQLRISTFSIMGIYIILLGVVLNPTIIALKMADEESKIEYLDVYATAWKVIAAVTIALPVVLNIVLSSTQICFLKHLGTSSKPEDNKKSIAMADQDFSPTSAKTKALESLIIKVTVATIICYTPEIIFRSWFIATVQQNKRTGSIGEVIFFFFARLSVQITSVVNPLIYATTIPKFKKMITNKFVLVKIFFL